MTRDEAISALAADPAALVWAGRDFDALAASLTDPEGSRVVRIARAAISAAADMPARLVVVRDGISAAASLLADREKQRADAEKFIAERDRAIRQAEHTRRMENERREQTHRATFPIFQALRARVSAAESAINGANSSADVESVLSTLAADFRDSTKTFRDVGASLFGKAA